MRRLAPEIFRKRLLIEGFSSRAELDAQTLRDYFASITSHLGLRTYGEPIIPRFLSVILYTCAEFDEGIATELTRDFFELTAWETALF